MTERELPVLALRDWFAVHAPAMPSDFPELQELRITDRNGRREPGYFPEHHTKRLIRWRWHWADEMMKARGLDGSPSSERPPAK